MQKDQIDNVKKNMKEILNNEFATVSYDEISNSVFSVWKKPSTSEAYKLIFTEILDELSRYNASAFISDIYQQGIVGTENRLWLQDVIMPAAYKKGLRKVATVTPNDVFSRFYIENMKNGALGKALDLEFQYFDDLISAQAWVMSEEVLV